MVKGEVKSSPTEWKDAGGSDGTYVYFGRIAPLETPNLIAIIDPGLPAWMHQQTIEFLPKLFDYFKEKLGVSLSFRPMVFFSYDPQDDGRIWKGGTLPGLVQLMVGGNAWKGDGEDRVQIFSFLAHEASHFWNGQMFRGEATTEWMHEGSADAFKYRALLDFGLISRERFLELVSSAANDCADRLRSGALNEAGKRRDFKAWYNCGAPVALATEAAVAHAQPRSNLFAFWRELLAEAASRRNTYSEPMYWWLLERATDNPALVDEVRSLVDRKLDPPGTTLGEVLQDVGLKVELVRDGLPSEIQRNLGAELMRHIQRQDCDGRISFYLRGEFIELGKLQECKTLGAGLQVDRIGDFLLLEDGAKAYDAAFERCAKNESLQLGRFGSSKTLEVPCKPIPARQPVLRVREVTYP